MDIKALLLEAKTAGKNWPLTRWVELITYLSEHYDDITVGEVRMIDEIAKITNVDERYYQVRNRLKSELQQLLINGMVSPSSYAQGAKVSPSIASSTWTSASSTAVDIGPLTITSTSGG